MVLAVVISACLGVLYWLRVRDYETTDDAFVSGDIVEVSARTSGIIQRVEIQDNQDVDAGTILIRIDPRDLQSRLDQAKATLEAAQAHATMAQTNIALVRANAEAMLTEAQAGVDRAKATVESSKSRLVSAQADVAAAKAEATRRQADLNRYKSLDPRATSQQQLDDAQAKADASSANLVAAQMRASAAEASVAETQAREAQAEGVLAAAQTGPQQVAVAVAQARDAQAAVDEAKAALDMAKLNLSYATIVAPIAGRVVRRTARPGQYLEVGQIVLDLVPPYVTVAANFKETQIAHMHKGQDVDIKVDCYPGHLFHGKVDSIQASTGTRLSPLPPENATGNYVKVVQRVPVKILFDTEAMRGWFLAPGMSVVPRVRIGSRKERPSPILPPAGPPGSATNPALTIHAPTVDSPVQQ